MKNKYFIQESSLHKSAHRRFQGYINLNSERKRKVFLVFMNLCELLKLLLESIRIRIIGELNLISEFSLPNTLVSEYSDSISISKCFENWKVRTNVCKNGPVPCIIWKRTNKILKIMGCGRHRFILSFEKSLKLKQLWICLDEPSKPTKPKKTVRFSERLLFKIVVVYKLFIIISACNGLKREPIGRLELCEKKHYWT